VSLLWSLCLDEGGADESGKERLEEMVRMLEAAGLDEVELNAARAAAKQKYLREPQRGVN